MNFNKSGGVDDAQVALGHAGVIRRLLDIPQHKDVPALGRHLVVGREIGGGLLAPLDERHRRADGHAGQVQRRAEHHLVHGVRRDRVVRRHSTHCVEEKKM